jgi:hypothetical protein
MHFSHSDVLVLLPALLSQWRSCVEPESGDKVEQTVLVPTVGLRKYHNNTISDFNVLKEYLGKVWRLIDLAMKDARFDHYRAASVGRKVPKSISDVNPV